MVHCGAKMVEDPGYTHDQGSKVNDQGSNSKSRTQDKGSKISRIENMGLILSRMGNLEKIRSSSVSATDITIIKKYTIQANIHHYSLLNRYSDDTSSNTTAQHEAQHKART